MARPSLFTHRKFRRLAMALGSRPLAVGSLELIWACGYEDGNSFLGTGEEVEYAADWAGERGLLVTALVASGFLDEVDGGFAIHDLLDHAPDYVGRRAGYEAERRIAKACAYCHGPFRSRERRAEYCSDACRKAAYRHRGCHGRETDADGRETDRDAPPAPAPAPALKRKSKKQKQNPPSPLAAPPPPEAEGSPARGAGAFLGALSGSSPEESATATAHSAPEARRKRKTDPGQGGAQEKAAVPAQPRKAARPKRQVSEAYPPGSDARAEIEADFTDLQPELPGILDELDAQHRRAHPAGQAYAPGHGIDLWLRRELSRLATQKRERWGRWKSPATDRREHQSAPAKKPRPKASSVRFARVPLPADESRTRLEHSYLAGTPVPCPECGHGGESLILAINRTEMRVLLCSRCQAPEATAAEHVPTPPTAAEAAKGATPQ